MAISDSRLRYLLSETTEFRTRLQIIMLQVAGEVLAEAGNVTHHTARVNHAKLVLNDPMRMAVLAAPYLAQTANVSATITMENEGPRTSVTDAALWSQVTSSWDVLAGIATN